jgi:phage baseplate assembly protein V
MTALVQGVVSGSVTAVDPAESPGWVEIEFLAEAGNTRTLARVATAMAGDERGTWWMPEVGDEVLVAFQNGHPANPFVIGYLWNGAVETPETEQQLRVFKSRRGHTLTFDDSDANKLEIRTSAGHTITLDDTEKKLVEITTEGETPHVITLDNKNRKIEVRSGGTPPQSIVLDDQAPAIRLQSGGRKLEITPSTVAFT